ncbi:MAG: FISUMP domain-containing protein, partial [Bacteroidales bacterium]
MNNHLNKRIAISIALQLTALAFTFGQQYGQTAESFKEPAFSVLWNNADLTNKKLLVEIMYEKQTCFHDAAEFWMYKKDEPTGGRRVKVDSLLNNQKNCTLSADSFTLSNPTAGGYRLRFALTDADTVASDSVRIRVVSKYQTFFSCKDCGAAYSEITIDSTSIHPDCPYNNVNYDLLACSRRTGGANNWEGFIVDHRDCKIYRIVAMPSIAVHNRGHGLRWWFAQNLNYTKNLIMSTSLDDEILGTYWCVGALSFDGKPRFPKSNGNRTKVSGGEPACKTYGALYPMNTIMSRDGFAPIQDDFSPIAQYSREQGICPIGWAVSSRTDWGVMLNKMEGCSDKDAETSNASVSILPNTCSNYNINSAEIPMEKDGQFKHLRSLLGSRRTLDEDSIFITATNPVWHWYGVGSKRQHGLRATDYYGFSLLPSGNLAGEGFNANGSCSYVGL